MNRKRLVEVAVMAGEIMLSSGAETYRVEDTMTHILNASGLPFAEAIVTGSAINVSLADDEDFIMTLVKRIDNRETDLGKIYRVNMVSRQFCGNEISLNDAYQELKRIKRHEPYTKKQRFIAKLGRSIFLTVLFGGTSVDYAVAVINGFLLAVLLVELERIKMNQFFTNLIGAFAVALSSVFVQKVLQVPISLDVVIAGSILSLLPGVAITNAIRDTLQGDYMSGGARAIEACVMATALSIGIGLGLLTLKL